MNEVALLKQEVAELKRENEELRKGKNSNNSHLPPSKDLFIPKRNQSLRKQSGKKSGGQEGHEGSTLKMSANPNHTILHRPNECEKCGLNLSSLQEELAERRQVVDIPPITPIYTEHQIVNKTCTCGHVNCSKFPNGVNSTIQYGANVEAWIAYMFARQYLPFQRTKELLFHFTGLKISEGTINNILQRFTSKALPSYQEIKAQIERAEYLGTDETGAKVNGSKYWFWAWQNKQLTFITQSESRGYKTIQRTFENGFPNAILQHDRWAAHFQCEAKNHQICIAHLQRELNYLKELCNHKWVRSFKTLIKKALELKAKLSFKNSYQKSKVRDKLEQLLDQLLKQKLPDKLKQAKTLQKKLLKIRDHLLVFLYYDKVPADNNGSEQAIRNIKVKQKISGQFKSIAGAEAFAVIRSIIDTAIKQDVNVFYVLEKIATFEAE